jgi:hypothetical protein
VGALISIPFYSHQHPVRAERGALLAGEVEACDRPGDLFSLWRVLDARVNAWVAKPSEFISREFCATIAPVLDVGLDCSAPRLDVARRDRAVSRPNVLDRNPINEPTATERLHELERGCDLRHGPALDPG